MFILFQYDSGIVLLTSFCPLSVDTNCNGTIFFVFLFLTFILLLNLHRDLTVYGGIFDIGKLYGSRGLGIVTKY